MIELVHDSREKIRAICGDTDNVLIMQCIEEGMGRVFIPDVEEPTFCLIHVANYAYLLGIAPKVKRAAQLWSLLARECKNAYIVPENEIWAEWLDENIDVNYRKFSRYHLLPSKEGMDKLALKTWVDTLPKEYTLKKADKSIYNLSFEHEWSEDFVDRYKDIASYKAYGAGYVLYKDDVLISGCMAYAYSQKRMDIVLATALEYRRKNLALTSAAKFLLSLEKKNVIPQLDVGNQHSVELATKLGYVLEKEYRVYELHFEY